MKDRVASVGFFCSLSPWLPDDCFLAVVRKQYFLCAQASLVSLRMSKFLCIRIPVRLDYMLQALSPFTG